MSNINNKTKYKIIVLCICIIIIAFSINLFLIKNNRGTKRKADDTNNANNVLEDNITIKEAYNLLNYLFVNGIDGNNLHNINLESNDALTYADLKILIDHLIIDNQIDQNIYQVISFEYDEMDKLILYEEFLKIYDHVISNIDNPLVKEEKIYILSIEDEDNTIFTNKGQYVDYTNTINDNYLLSQLKVLSTENEIIFIKEMVNEPIEFKNVLIRKGKDSNLDAFISGIENNFSTIYPLSTEVENVVGDITIQDKQIIQISVKPDIISGKVLLTGKDFIEIEGYGKVPLDEAYQIYKIYGDLTLEPTNSILVGYDVTDFVVSNGVINAALIKDKIKAENIRVLLLNNGFKDIHHSKITLTSNKEFTITYGDKVKKYDAKEKVNIKKGDKLLADGRIKIETSSEKARIEILSIERASGNPKYRGTIEIAEDKNGLFIVNELSLEEYLYSVIPSEMPTYYGVEALKVQAICARSYAYKHLYENKLKNYGAHVDDSISYQVYNNIAENDDSILAVKDTYGKVIKYNDEIISAYYFSTSCGHTTSIDNVWGGDKVDYLQGKLMVANDSVSTIATDKDNKIEYKDLSNDKNFRDFITNKKILTYDSEFNWYRWNVTMSVANIKKVIDQKLSSRYEANPSLILTEVKNGDSTVYESKAIDSIGDLKDIVILNRGEGGIITELLIKGSKQNIKVLSEYNIRTLLAPLYDSVNRIDDTSIPNLTLLPSAFFVIDKVDKNDKLHSFKIIGGGYGHGVGMSQNGVKSMVESGMEYEDILKYFYQGTNIGNIYKEKD
ncbi:MAG TPA: SpoIID/LytB domain-containing protein [Clostridiales bacterium]|nr:SpoIID/LytB domain-containing protein [Clostridiales bacterium]